MEQRSKRIRAERFVPEDHTKREKSPERTPGQHALRMLETVPDAVVNIDTEGRFLYANPTAEHIFGREASTLIGRILWEEIPATGCTTIEKELRRAIEQHT